MNEESNTPYSFVYLAYLLILLYCCALPISLRKNVTSTSWPPSSFQSCTLGKDSPDTTLKKAATLVLRYIAIIRI